MPLLDLLIFGLYMAGMLSIGFYFFKKNETEEEYYLAGRNMKSLHVGLSVVATDVGGGFSIGLGGLGFTMGLAGSWMLFTGLVGAWLSAVFLIPSVKPRSNHFKFLTFPDLLEHHYNTHVAILAGIISAVGYLGFTSSQILAGAKLASAAFPDLDQYTALILIGSIIVGYTVMGGIKAVIYTDTAQWLILMLGLIGIGIPVAYFSIGGMEVLQATLDTSFWSLSHISWAQLLSWGVTIVPIWFVAMTLYQRIYTTRSVREAQRAWYLAGLFEWPVMAFMGVILGMFARVAAEHGMFTVLGYPDAMSMDAEMGLPLLLRSVLPVGLMGIMMAAYFSAIMSTADSCLLAASGNVLSDLLAKTGLVPRHTRKASRIVTLLLGGLALVLASAMQNVLALMLYSYAFMVSGLFVPVLGILTGKSGNPTAAFWAMLTGGTTTVVLTLFNNYQIINLPFELDGNVFGLLLSAFVFFSLFNSMEKS